MHSLDRDERLFELNPQTLLVPASVAKLVSVASAVRGGRLGLPLRDHAARHRADRRRRAARRSARRRLRRSQLGGRAGSTAFRGLGRRAEGARASSASRGASSATTTPSRSRGRSWPGPGTTSATRPARCSARSTSPRTASTVTVDAGRRTTGAPATLSVEPQRGASPAGQPRRRPPAADAAQLLWPEQRPGEAALTIAGSIRAGAQAGAAAGLGGQPHAVVRERPARPPDREAASRSRARPWTSTTCSRRREREYATLLFTHRSPPLREIVRPLLKDSINLYGEALMRLNAAPGRAAHQRRRARRAEPAARGVGRAAGRASRSSTARACRAATRMSPEALLAVLQRMYDPAGKSPFMHGAADRRRGRLAGQPA